jgi:hypothetical protein
MKKSMIMVVVLAILFVGILFASGVFLLNKTINNMEVKERIIYVDECSPESLKDERAMLERIAMKNRMAYENLKESCMCSPNSMIVFAELADRIDDDIYNGLICCETERQKRSTCEDTLQELESWEYEKIRRQLECEKQAGATWYDGICVVPPAKEGK